MHSIQKVNNDINGSGTCIYTENEEIEMKRQKRMQEIQEPSLSDNVDRNKETKKTPTMSLAKRTKKLKEQE